MGDDEEQRIFLLRHHLEISVLGDLYRLQVLLGRPVAVDIQPVPAELFGMGRVEVAPGLQVGDQTIQMGQPGGGLAEPVQQGLDPEDKLIVGYLIIGYAVPVGVSVQRLQDRIYLFQLRQVGDPGNFFLRQVDMHHPGAL